jgi:hypothetical protein
MDIVAIRLKTGIVEQIDAAIAMQRCGKHISAAVNEYATVEELLEAVFSMQSVPRLYRKNQQEMLVRKTYNNLLMLMLSWNMYVGYSPSLPVQWDGDVPLCHSAEVRNGL